MFSTPAKTRYDITFSIAKIPVRIHPLFWLLVMALGWGDISFAELIIWAGCVFVSVLVHEFGHGLVARHFGAKNIRIILHGMGGQATFNSNLTRKERMIELLGGPGAGFLLLVLVFISAKMFSPFFQNQLFHFAALQLIYINLVWNLLNLLPILPLDGGQIMNEVICQKRPWDGRDISIKISGAVSIAVALIFAILAIIALVRGTPAHWFPVLIFALLAVLNYQMYKYKYQLDNHQRGQEPRKSWERDPDWWKK